MPTNQFAIYHFLFRKTTDAFAVEQALRSPHRGKPDPLVVVCAVRPDAVVTMNSAFYLHEMKVFKIVGSVLTVRKTAHEYRQDALLSVAWYSLRLMSGVR